jgi:alpha-1,6-mannosyltransferase
MPRNRRVALAASALLAVMLPPTGADFAFRSFQLPLAILAGIVILLVALLAVRRELLRASDPARTALPGAPLPDDAAVPVEQSAADVAASPSDRRA